MEPIQLPYSDSDSSDYSEVELDIPDNEYEICSEDKEYNKFIKKNISKNKFKKINNS